MTRILPIAALAAAASLVLATGAQADSVSFLRGGDIWVAAADGTRQVQLTHDGGYAYQSRADDGSFIALRGRRLRRLSADGRVLADFDTPVSGEQTAPHTSFFRGPFKPEISPDGTKVAYEYRYQEYYSQPGCTPVGDPSCTDTRISVGIGYSHSDRQTAWDEPGLGRQSGWVDPSWIDNSTLLQSDKSVRPNVDAIIDHPGDGNQTIQQWFEDTGLWYVRDGEVSRRGDAAAFVSTLPKPASDPNQTREDDQVTIYRLTGAPPALPEQCFSFRNSDAIYSSPTFSPDGSHIAWGADSWVDDTKVILVGEIPSQAGGCQLPAAGGSTVLSDAIQPDWSPAPVPTPAAGGAGNAGGGAQPGGGTAKPGGATAGGGATGSGSGAAGGEPGLRVTVTAGTLGRALARGIRVRVTAPRTGRLVVTVLRGRRTVASGHAAVLGAGDVTATARFTPAARRGLRRARSVRLTVRYRFVPNTGAAVTGARTVTLRRR